MGKIRVIKIGKPITRLFDSETLTRVLLAEAEAVQADYQKTVKTWTNKPVFKIKPEGKFAVFVGTSDTIYGYVELGTRPHIIRPKRAKALRFNSAGFKPKTTPSQLTAVSGSPASPPTVYTQEVNHPGTQARNFTPKIAKRAQSRLSRAAQIALKKSPT